MILRAPHARFLFEAPENIFRKVLNQAFYKLGEWEGPLLFSCVVPETGRLGTGS